jgi:hypothetical protein
MDRAENLARLSMVLRNHLVNSREHLLTRIDLERWDPIKSSELTILDEALTRLGHFDRD